MAQGVREIVREFLRAQRSVRALQRENPGPAPIAASHLLVYLSRHSTAKPSELAEHLQLPASKVTRILKDLSEKKAISIEISHHDRRERTVKLTRSGTRVLQQVDESANRNTDLWFSKMNGRQRKLFEKFLAHLADALGAPAEEHRETEISIRREQRRIARSGGLFGGVLMKSKLSLLEYHILLVVISADVPLRMDRLFDLPFDRAAISRASDGLRRSGILRKEPDKSDRRCILASMTRKGEQTFLKAEDEILKAFKKALSRFNKTETDSIRKSLLVIANTSPQALVAGE